MEGSILEKKGRRKGRKQWCRFQNVGICVLGLGFVHLVGGVGVLGSCLQPIFVDLL